MKPETILRSLELFLYREKNRLVNLFDRPVIVLLYHRVTALRSDPQRLAVTPENFRAHLRFLKNYFPLVRLEDDWSGSKKPAVAISFDDGYADCALEALPIIEEVGVPVTFFVATGTIGTPEQFWWDELEHIVLTERDFPGRFILNAEGFEQAWKTETAADRLILFREIHILMKKTDVQRRNSLLQQLRRWAGIENLTSAEHRAMTVEELRRLAGSTWVSIGAHTVSHTPLSSLPLEEQRREIVESRLQLESWLAKKVSLFSYPFGTREDYTLETVRICKEAGFLKAAANYPAQAHSWTDPYQVPRQVVRNWPVETFAERLKEFWVS